MVVSVMDKQCFKCGCVKPDSEFYRHKAMAGGRLGKCKQCTISDVSAYRAKNLERIREYDRQRGLLPHRKKAAAAYGARPDSKSRRALGTKRDHERNRLKRTARRMVRTAIMNGALVPLPCEKCGDAKAHAHHDDYSVPLAVMWLCTKHHGERHRELNASRRLAVWVADIRPE